MDAYTQTLMRTIGKVFQLPHYRSKEYTVLQNQINTLLIGIKSGQIDRQQAAEQLYQILSGLTRLPPKEGRVEERIGTIVEMVKSRNLTPRTILDIGAGTGEILIGLKEYYKLPTNNVFAIDQKLPAIVSITPLTYLDKKIPLSDGSIDLVIMLMTLHHIPVEARPGLIAEIARILSPDGVVIIREHDNTYDPDFYIFLDLLHIFWYVAAGETPDPLYLMTRVETQSLFTQAGLQSAFYSKYPEPNPQQIYHEMFIHRPIIRPYKFQDTAAQSTLQNYINRVRLTPPTYTSFVTVIPVNSRPLLVSKYSITNQSNLVPIWPEIVKEIGLSLILGAVKYAPIREGTYYLTSNSIDSAAKDLGY